MSLCVTRSRYSSLRAICLHASIRVETQTWTTVLMFAPRLFNVLYC